VRKPLSGVESVNKEETHQASGSLNPVELSFAVESFLAEGVIWIKHISKGKEKSKNIRDQIIDMQLLDSSNLELRLKSTQRVDQVLNALIPGSIWQICKTGTILADANSVTFV
jgi:hypothetical protein